MLCAGALRVFVIAIAALAAAFAFSAPLQAQDETYVDLSIEIAGGEFIARNDGTADAYGVTVDIELADQIIGSTVGGQFKQKSGTTCSGNIPGATCSSGVWTVGRLGVNEEAKLSISSRLVPGLGVGSIWTVPTRAVIKSTVPEEEARFRSDNIAVAWFNVGLSLTSPSVAVSNYWLEASVDDLFPDAGDTVTFTFKANRGTAAQIGSMIIADTGIRSAKLRLKLDNGMGTPTATPAAGTTFAAATGLARTWDWGFDLSVPLHSTLEVSTTLDNQLPGGVARSDLCLTAELTARVSANIPYINRVANYTTAEICLREDPVVLLQEGQATLFSIHPCVGVTAYPCSSDNTIEMRVTGARVVGNSAARAAGIARDHAVLRPDRVLVQVKDPEGRRIDTFSDSVNSGTAPSWHTARPAHGSLAGSTGVGGVDVHYTHRAFTTEQKAKYSRLDLTAAVSGLDEPTAPGSLYIRYTNTEPSVDPTAEFKPNPSQTNEESYFDVDTNKYQSFVEFSTLGTYKLDYTAAATHTNGQVYSGTGSYVFHVGPVAELEVRDGGPQPGLASTQRAFTILAVNNGPDDAPAVQVTVTGLDAGEYVSHTATAGSFDTDTGIWTIGELRGPGYHQDIYGRDGEALTIFVSADANSATTAKIENTQDYQVCIDSSGRDVELSSPSEMACTSASSTNTWHTAGYFDHVGDNNMADIGPWPGAAEEHPDAPASLTVRGTALGNILTWKPVEVLNARRVAHYQVQRFDLLRARWERVGEARGTIYLDEEAKPEFPVYRVRAVNSMGVGGPWSRPVPDAGLDLPGDAPTVVGAGVASTPGAGDAYQLGETIALEIIFSEPVRVQGTPALALNVGDATRQVPMATHRGDTLTFRYAVAAGDSDNDGVSVPENGLTLPDGASITSLEGKVAALGFPGLDDQGGHKVNAPIDDPEPPQPYYVEVPDAPGSLTATPGNGYVLLQWAPYCCDQKDIFYQLWRGDFPTWQKIAGSNRDTVEHIVSGLTNDETYRFQVRAVYLREADDGTMTEHPGAPSRTVVATPYAPKPDPVPNRPPVFDRPNNESFSVVERAPRGAYVATVRATDPDGDALTYTLMGENAARFSIANVNGEGVITVAEEELSYTWEPGGLTFSIGVEVTDDRGGRDNRSIGVEVTASEQRNNAPVAEDPGELSVACGATEGAYVGTITATDPEGDALWYILVDGADYFGFEGGGTGMHPDSFWSQEHAVRKSDGSGVQLQVAESKTLSGDVCGRLITVIVEIEEEDNPGNNDTLDFQVRVE